MGWGIKLKNNNFKKVILVIIAVIIGCNFLYILVDVFLDGTFVNWFTKNYVVTEYRYIPTTGEIGLVTTLRWYEIKTMLLMFLIISSLAVVLITYIMAKRKEKKVITDISQKLKMYMNEEVGINDVFLPNQAEVSAQMVEIKTKLLYNEQVLREETRRKNDLITYLAHDLKTPLTSIIGYLSILNEIDDMPKKQQKKYLGIALNKTYKLEDLINELFDVARFNAKEIGLIKEELNLNLMLEQIIDDFYPLTRELNKNIKLNTNSLIKINADPDKLSRVFTNIIKNALNYSSDASEIVIDVKKNKSKVVIEIKNKGEQIPKEMLDKLFEKFYRADVSRNSKTGGSGLGLAIAKDIVELHNGVITVESSKKETIFRVELPLK